MEAVRSDRDLKRRVVGKNGDGFIGLGIDQFDEMFDLFAAKIAAVMSVTERVQRDQPHGIIFDRVVDELTAGREISGFGEGRAQIGPLVLVARQDINRRARLCEQRGGLRIFIAPAVMDDIAGVDDRIGRRIERVDIRDGEREIAHAPLGVARVEREMGVGDLRDDHLQGAAIVIARSNRFARNDDSIKITIRPSLSAQRNIPSKSPPLLAD